MHSSTSISADLAAHLSYLEDALAVARGAPLSSKRAMLCALLIDAFVDRAFARGGAEGDILVFREHLAARSPALALLFGLVAMRPQGAGLVIETVEIALPDYGALPVEDFMVSLYNANSVQRLQIAEPNGARHDIHTVLEEAAEAVRALMP